MNTEMKNVDKEFEGVGPQIVDVNIELLLSTIAELDGTWKEMGRKSPLGNEVNDTLCHLSPTYKKMEAEQRVEILNAVVDVIWRGVSLTASQKVKAAGLKSLSQLSEMTGVSLQTLTNWYKDKPKLFDVLIEGALAHSKNILEL
jgi:DNA-binding transcriptional ArsR family regulator